MGNISAQSKNKGPYVSKSLSLKLTSVMENKDCSLLSSFMAMSSVIAFEKNIFLATYVELQGPVSVTVHITISS